jgi:hypothetical protein
MMQNPLTPEEIRQKYLKLATTVTAVSHAERIVEVIAQVDHLDTVRTLAVMLRNLAPPKPGRATRMVPRLSRAKTARASVTASRKRGEGKLS